MVSWVVVREVGPMKDACDLHAMQGSWLRTRQARLARLEGRGEGGSDHVSVLGNDTDKCEISLDPEAVLWVALPYRRDPKH